MMVNCLKVKSSIGMLKILLMENLIFHYQFSEKLILLTLSLPVPCWAGAKTDLPLNSNISTTLRVNNAYAKNVFKEYLISFLMIFRLIGFALVVLQLLMFKVCRIIGISKINIFHFCDTERVNKIHLIKMIRQFSKSFPFDVS